VVRHLGLVTVLLASLTYGIIEGPAAGWPSAGILASFAASAIALALLVPWERRRAEPLIELRVFRSVPFTGALVTTLCAFAALAGFLFLTTLYLQDVRGLTVWQAGLALIPLAAATAVAGPLAGRAMGRGGARGPLTFAGVAGGITSAGRQAGQSLGVSVTGAIFAAGLHGATRTGFASASHPAWLALAACGFVVLLLGGVTTSRRALRTAVRAAGSETARSTARVVLLGAGR
jgi:hypothetical protein